jgi:hypothetical protein
MWDAEKVDAYENMQVPDGEGLHDQSVTTAHMGLAVK